MTNIKLLAGVLIGIENEIDAGNGCAMLKIEGNSSVTMLRFQISCGLLGGRHALLESRSFERERKKWLSQSLLQTTANVSASLFKRDFFLYHFALCR